MKDPLCYMEKYCTRCGKPFIVHSVTEWAYRSAKDETAPLFCSWSCLQAFRKERPSKIDRRDRIIQMIEEHPEMTTPEIARALGEEPKTIFNIRRKIMKETGVKGVAADA